MSAFTEQQVANLSAPLDRNNVRTRVQSGQTLSYIEGWQAIAEANRIFGFGEWSSETLETRCVSERPRKIGKQQRDGFSVSYVARVRIVVDTQGGVVSREGVGAGHGIDVDLGLAHESAIKEAETDARKRALMTFGNPFGLALYDKEQTNVRDLMKEAAEREAERAVITQAGEWELLATAFEDACRIAEGAADILDAEADFKKGAPRGQRLPPGMKDRLVAAKNGALARLAQTLEAAE
jgi:DNA recombination protein Rad52